MLDSVISPSSKAYPNTSNSGNAPSNSPIVPSVLLVCLKLAVIATGTPTFAVTSLGSAVKITQLSTVIPSVTLSDGLSLVAHQLLLARREPLVKSEEMSFSPVPMITELCISNMLRVVRSLFANFMEIAEPFVATFPSNIQFEICTLPVVAAIAPPRPFLSPALLSRAVLLMNLELDAYNVAFAFTKIAPPSAL